MNCCLSCVVWQVLWCGTQMMFQDLDTHCLSFPELMKDHS